MHCFAPGFFPGTGSEEENSERILNVPFEKHTKDDEYIKKFDTVVCPFIQKANPDIIIISNGLDAHIDDTFKVMDLTSKFYIHVTKYLKSLDKSLIYILEGGYNPEVIGNISKDIITTIIT
jgi:acetoin utilization deacetylase AcuC-like enzyme